MFNSWLNADATWRWVFFCFVFCFWQEEDRVPCQPCPMLCISSCTQQKWAFSCENCHVLFKRPYCSRICLIHHNHFCSNLCAKTFHLNSFCTWTFLCFSFYSLSVADMKSRIAGALILSDVSFACWGQTLPSDMHASSHWFQWDS